MEEGETRPCAVGEPLWDGVERDREEGGQWHRPAGGDDVR